MSQTRPPKAKYGHVGYFLVAVNQYRFLTETPKTNNPVFKNRILANTNHWSDTLCFGQKRLFWPKEDSFGQ